MNLIILAIVGFIALAFLVDAVRQTSKRKKKLSAEPERILSADESGPTETGRFRARQALGGGPGKSGAPTPTAAPTGADDEEPLPDPFDGGDEGKKKGSE